MDEQLIGALRRALKPKRGGAPSDKQLAAVIALERGQTRALTALPEGGARNRARQLHSRAVDLGLFQSQMSTATMDVLPAAPSMTSCIDMLPSDMLVHSSNSSGRRRQQCWPVGVAHVPGRAVHWAATSRAAMERSSRFRPPLRRLCSSTASERCFASADFLLTVQDDVYEHGGRRGRALDAPRVNGGGAGGFGGAFFVCVTRVARHARGRCVGCQRACCWPCACAHSALRLMRGTSAAPCRLMLCDDVSATRERARRTCGAPVYWRASVHVTCDQ